MTDNTGGDIATLNYETMLQAIKWATGDNKVVSILCYPDAWSRDDGFMVAVTGEDLQITTISDTIEEAVISAVNAFYRPQGEVIT